MQIFSISSALEIIELFFFSHKSIKFSSPLSNNKFRELKKLFSCPKILLCLFTLHSSHLFLSIFLCCGDDRRILNYMLTTHRVRGAVANDFRCVSRNEKHLSHFFVLLDAFHTATFFSRFFDAQKIVIWDF